MNNMNTRNNVNFGMRFTFTGPKARNYARALDGGMHAQGTPTSLVYDEMHNGAVHLATDFDALQCDTCEQNHTQSIAEFFKNAVKIITK